MKNERLLNALEQVDEKFITASAPENTKKTKKAKSNAWIKWGALAACFYLIVGICLYHITETNYEAPAIVVVFFDNDVYIRVNPNESADIELQTLGLPERITDDMIGDFIGYATVEGNLKQYKVYEYTDYENNDILILYGIPVDGYSFIVQEDYHLEYSK